MHTQMFQFVKKHLEDNNCEAAQIAYLPFWKRSEHIKRVSMWVERLMDGLPSIDKESVLVASIFHDVGYTSSKDNSKHAENSAAICEKYLADNGFAADFIGKIVYLVKNHSNKELMTVKDTPLELILLMEADLLDATGALSIVCDCMMEGSEQAQTFEKTYHHILRYSYKDFKTNPMITDKAKEFWESKRTLTQEFIRHLSYDLGIPL